MSESPQIQIVIRSVLPSDRGFIFATWLRGNYYGTHFGNMPPDLYYAEYSKVIEEIEKDPETEIRIACDEADPAWIVGFSVRRGSLLYWVHVKRDFRNRGIATLLTHNQNITTVRAMTKAGRAIAEKKGLIYNPIQGETHGS